MLAMYIGSELDEKEMESNRPKYLGEDNSSSKTTAGNSSNQEVGGFSFNPNSGGNNDQNQSNNFDAAQYQYQLKEYYSSNWRTPGTSSYRFQLQWRREKITLLDELRNINLQEFERRRRLQSGILSFTLSCCVNGEIVGSTPALTLNYDTWSTTGNLVKLLNSEGGVADLSASSCPYTFSLCVHTMPKNVELQLYVGYHSTSMGLSNVINCLSGGCLGRRKWVKIGTAQVGIPCSERHMTRLTHTPVVRQQLVMGCDGTGKGLIFDSMSKLLSHNNASHDKGFGSGQGSGYSSTNPTGAQIISAGSYNRSQQQSTSKGTNLGTAAPIEVNPQKALIEELQLAMQDRECSTAVVKIRTLWPLTLQSNALKQKKMGSGSSYGSINNSLLPPPPLAEVSVMESINRVFEAGEHTLIPAFHRLGDGIRGMTGMHVDDGHGGDGNRNSSGSEFEPLSLSPKKRVSQLKEREQYRDSIGTQVGRPIGLLQAPPLSSNNEDLSEIATRTAKLLSELKLDPNHPLVMASKADLELEAGMFASGVPTTDGQGRIHSPKHGSHHGHGHHKQHQNVNDFGVLKKAAFCT